MLRAFYTRGERGNTRESGCTVGLPTPLPAGGRPDGQAGAVGDSPGHGHRAFLCPGPVLEGAGAAPGGGGLY